MEPFVFSIKDSYRQAVEAQTGGKNTVLYDDQGNPSIMVRIPRFNLSDIIDGATNEPHPAFIVDSNIKDEIFISKYQNIIKNDRAYSIPNQDPETGINFDTARDACFNKGEGWHLMTNAEWAAIALWCLKNGYFPRGNNDYGRDYQAPYETGVETHQSGDQTGRVATGSGPAAWSHDGTLAGIYDLNGNVWEWIDGFKTLDGKMFIHPNNSFQTGNEEENTDGWQDLELYTDEIGGDVVINGARTSEVTGSDSSISHNFKDITKEEGINIPDIMVHLGLFPPENAEEIGGDYIYMRNEGERLARRGSIWARDSRAGVFSLSLSYTRSLTSNSAGFRSAFISV